MTKLEAVQIALAVLFLGMVLGCHATAYFHCRDFGQSYAFNGQHIVCVP